MSEPSKSASPKRLVFVIVIGALLGWICVMWRASNAPIVDAPASVDPQVAPRGDSDSRPPGLSEEEIAKIAAAEVKRRDGWSCKPRLLGYEGYWLVWFERQDGNWKEQRQVTVDIAGKVLDYRDPTKAQ